MATNYGFAGPRIVSDGLVLYLDAGNPNSYNPSTPLTWRDLSGNRNNGTLTNGPTFNSANGGSIVFDGVNDEINLSPSSTIQNLTTNFTISVIVRTNTSGGQYGIFTKGSQFSLGWTLYLRQGPQFAFLGLNASGTSSGIIATPAGEILTNTWYLVTYTYNGFSVIGYINAQEKVSTALPSFIFSSAGTNPIIGRDPSLSVPPTYWSGNIAQVSIYNRALSPAEITQNFNATRGRFGL